MARRRSAGGGGFTMNPILQLYMQHMLSQQRAQQEHELSLTRMREQQGIDTAQSMLPEIRSGSRMPGSLPPELIERLGGQSVVESMIPSQTSLEGPAREQLRQAETQADVPDIQTLISERASKPITELGPLTGTLQARQSRLGQLSNDQQFQDDRTLAMAKGTARETAMGTEQATEQNFPAELSRALQEGQQENRLAQDQFRAMTPLEVGRAGETTAAQQAAQAPYDTQLAPGVGPDGLPAYATVNLQSGSSTPVSGIAPFAPAGSAAAGGLQGRTLTGLMRFSQLWRLWDNAKPAIEESMLASNLGSFGAATLDSVPYFAQPTALRLYNEAVEAALPEAARITGEVGNLAEQEQLRQRYSFPTAMDALTGTGEEKLSRTIAYILSAPILQAAAADPTWRQLNTTERMRRVDQIVSQTVQELQLNREQVLGPPVEEPGAPPGLGAPPAYPGEPPPLQDGIPPAEDINSVRERLRQLQQGNR